MKVRHQLAPIALISFSLLAGCSAEPGVEQNAPPEAPSPSDDDGSPSDDDGATKTTGGEPGSSGGEQCGPGSVDESDPCEACVVQNCMIEAYECCMQDGCLELVDCAREHSCNGVDCYSPDKCQAEIDAAGGAQWAMAYAMPLADCATTHCADTCGQ